MMKQRNSLLFYFVFTIAGIGLISWLTKNPSNFFTTILITAIFATVVFLIIRAVMRRRVGNANYNETRKYRQAVKQSRKRYEQPKAKVVHKKMRRHRDRPNHLKLVKGNKQVKRDNNDRASN
ncbi:MAG TPA: SA1362 family protein [Pseudogracilibacillus sp.]|nr:SA1362 family protein [Pseudogracilibacillus sp.]